MTKQWRSQDSEIQDDLSPCEPSIPDRDEWLAYLRAVDEAKVRGEILPDFKDWIQTKEEK
jgi:hypothetical protein